MLDKLLLLWALGAPSRHPLTVPEAEGSHASQGQRTLALAELASAAGAALRGGPAHARLRS